MKVLVRTLFLLAIILTVIFYSDQSVQQNDLLEAPKSIGQAFPQEDLLSPLGKTTIPRPTEGLSTLIGQKTSKLVESFGEPNRVEPTTFGYEWWVYNTSFTRYMLVGVNQDKISQVYVVGEKLDASPYQIRNSIDDVYRFTIIESEISVRIDSNVYTFTINELDTMNRLLVEFDGLFAQIYVDQEDREVEAIRFMDPTTLVLHQPYEMTYRGEYLAPVTPSTDKQKAIDNSNQRIIFELTNIYRSRHAVQPVLEDPLLAMVARKHSEDMAKQNYLSNESHDSGDLESRLREAQIEFESAGENIASNYYDSAEVVHGWFNSSDHRKVLLRKDFTHLGVGTFGKFYTQNFIKSNWIEQPMIN